MTTMTAHDIRRCGIAVIVFVDNQTGLVIDAPPIVADFIGQPLSNLLKCMERFEAVQDESRKCADT
jgi:hypothetical protein